jgi:hypothetical protein
VVGTDWISIARWITVAHGFLTILSIFAFGLLVPSITVPVQDPSTGQVVDQTLNIRPVLALAAFFAIGFYALIVWLTKYGLARAIMLLVVVLEMLLALGRLGSAPTATVVAGVIGLLVAAAFAFVLIMTFVSPQRRAPVNTHTPIPVQMAPRRRLHPRHRPSRTRSPAALFSGGGMRPASTNDAHRSGHRGAGSHRRPRVWPLH